jgi:hypothetical protein
MEAALIIGGICGYAAVVCVIVLIAAHITAKRLARRRWLRMEQERRAALRAGEILTGRKGGGK